MPREKIPFDEVIDYQIVTERKDPENAQIWHISEFFVFLSRLKH